MPWDLDAGEVFARLEVLDMGSVMRFAQAYGVCLEPIRLRRSIRQGFIHEIRHLDNLCTKPYHHFTSLSQPISASRSQ